ncbi:hypothetical protein HN51_055090, partial [Arachis hypogaea]
MTARAREQRVRGGHCRNAATAAAIAVVEEGVRRRERERRFTNEMEREDEDVTRERRRLFRRALSSLLGSIEAVAVARACHAPVLTFGFDFSASRGLGPNDVAAAITRKMSQLNPNSSCAQTEGSEAQCPLKCGKVIFGGKLSDEDFDEMLKRCLGNVGGGGKGGREVRAVVGKYRHAWVLGHILEDEAASRTAEIFARLFMSGGSEGNSIRSEFMPVGADGRGFHEIDKTLLHPVIQALQPIANITVESQVLYYTPKSSFSYWDDIHGSHIFSTKDLPFFVYILFGLDLFIIKSQRFEHFEVPVSIEYIPSAKECPLQLELPNGDLSKTNGFISPMWGGVVVWNPESCVKDLESKDPDRRVISPQ